MSRFGNRKGLIEPQGASLSWDWNGTAQDDDDLFPKGIVSNPVLGQNRAQNSSDTTYTTSRPSSLGTKRTLGDIDLGRNTLAKRQKTTHPPPTAQRATQSSSSRLTSKPASKARASTMAPPTRSSQPFVIDDSSSDEEQEKPPKPKSTFREPSPVRAPAARSKVLPKEVDKATQLARSQKLREEAYAKRAASMAPNLEPPVNAVDTRLNSVPPVTSMFKQPTFRLPELREPTFKEPASSREASTRSREEADRIKRLQTSRRIREGTNKNRFGQQRASSVMPAPISRPIRVSSPPLSRRLGSPFRPSTRERPLPATAPKPSAKPKEPIINLDSDEDEDEIDLMSAIRQNKPKRPVTSKEPSKPIVAPLASKRNDRPSTKPPSSDVADKRSIILEPMVFLKQDNSKPPSPTESGPLLGSESSSPAITAAREQPRGSDKAPQNAITSSIPANAENEQEKQRCLQADQGAADNSSSITVNAENEQDKQRRLKEKQDVADEAFAKQLQQKSELAKQKAEAARKNAEEDRAKKEERARRERSQQEEQQRLERARSEEQRRAREEELRKQASRRQEEEDNARKAQEQLQENLKKQEVARKEREAAKQAELAKKKAEQEAAREAMTPEAREALRKKEERIQKLKERNVNLHKDDHYSDKELIVEEPPAVPKALQPKSLALAVRGAGYQQLHDRQENPEDDILDFDLEQDEGPNSSNTPKPMSLDSLAVAQAVSGSSRIADTKAGQQNHTRPLGLIMPEDAAVQHWRDTGDSWAAIATKYEALTQRRRAEETLRKRYSIVKKALKQAQVSPLLVQQLMNDEADASRQVNLKVHGEWPVPLIPRNTAQQQSSAPNDSGATAPMPSITIAEQLRKSTKYSKLGEIKPKDGKLLQWHDEGRTWPEIEALYEKYTGNPKAANTLNSRYNLVSKAFKLANVTTEQRDLLAQGDYETIKHIHTLVNSEAASRNGQSSGRTSDQDSAQNSAQTSTNKHESTSTVKPSKAVENLRGGDNILPIDAKLICWRQSNLEWSEISKLYHKATGARRSDTTLRSRYREAKEVLDSANIDQDLIDSLAKGDQRAQEDIKRWIEHRRSEGDLPAEEPIITPQTSFTASSRTISPSPQPRPTTGGKQLTVENMWQFMRDQQEAWEEMEEEDTKKAASEIDPEEPEDYNFHVYRVARKECTLQEQDEGINIDDKHWSYSAVEYEDLSKANAAAYLESILTPPGLIDFNKGTFTKQSGVDKDGGQYYQIDNPEVGTLLIAIDRITRTYADKILPKSKDHWRSRSQYMVYTRCEDPSKFTETVVREEVDDVLGTTTKFVVRTVLQAEKVKRGTGTDSLKEANERAAKVFADLIIKPSGNLSCDSRRKEQVVQNLLEELEERGLEEENGDGEVLFEREVGEAGDGQVKVWVEVVGVSGVRN